MARPGQSYLDSKVKRSFSGIFGQSSDVLVLESVIANTTDARSNKLYHMLRAASPVNDGHVNAMTFWHYLGSIAVSDRLL